MASVDYWSREIERIEIKKHAYTYTTTLLLKGGINHMAGRLEMGLIDDFQQVPFYDQLHFGFCVPMINWAGYLVFKAVGMAGHFDAIPEFVTTARSRLEQYFNNNIMVPNSINWADLILISNVPIAPQLMHKHRERCEKRFGEILRQTNEPTPTNPQNPAAKRETANTQAEAAPDQPSTSKGNQAVDFSRSIDEVLREWEEGEDQ